MIQRHDKESAREVVEDALGRRAGGSSAVHPSGTVGASGSGVLDFAAIMATLRSDCAWNRLQTHESLARYIVEEAHELVEAIEAGVDDDIAEELGDVLYSVLFHAVIAEERGGFTVDDVAWRAAAKMIRRHPHVFGGISAPTPEDVERVWDAVKAQEKSHRASALEGLPTGLPALLLADKMLGRAASVDVRPDLVGAAGPSLHPAGIDPAALTSEAELGAALLALVAAGKAAGLDAERALRTRLRELADEVRDAEAALATAAAGTAANTAASAPVTGGDALERD